MDTQGHSETTRSRTLHAPSLNEWRTREMNVLGKRTPGRAPPLTSPLGSSSHRWHIHHRCSTTCYLAIDGEADVFRSTGNVSSLGGRTGGGEGGREWRGLLPLLPHLAPSRPSQWGWSGRTKLGGWMGCRGTGRALVGVSGCGTQWGGCGVGWRCFLTNIARRWMYWGEKKRWGA